MRIHDLNVLAILVATVSAFLLGGLGYSPLLFGKAWQKANGFGEGGQKGMLAGCLVSAPFSAL